MTTLVRQRNLTRFRIGFPEKDHTAEGHGRTAMGSYLNYALTRPGFERHVKMVVIVSDNDRPDALTLVTEQIPTDKYAKPAAVQTRAHVDGKIDVAVVLVPLKGLPFKLSNAAFDPLATYLASVT